MPHMVLDGEDSASGLLKAHTHIWNHLFSFINSASLKCAVELGIPDIIHKHGKPMTLSELVSSLQVHPTKTSNVYRLMRTLTNSGIFAIHQINKEEENDELGYVLAPSAHFLLDSNPLSVTQFLLAMLDPVFIKPWGQMSTWFGNDDPTPFDTTYGMNLWEMTAIDHKVDNFINEGMACDARLVQSVVLEKSKCVFEGLKSLVDVGGGSGTMARAIASAFPDLCCTNFDLPHVVAGLDGTRNLKHVQGDMFDVIPPADAIMLKSTLHDWSDEDCVKVLKKCKEALLTNAGGEGARGKVIIIEMVVDEQNGDKQALETQLFFDMLMMTLVPGKERSEKEWTKLFEEAGFMSYKILPIIGLRSLIEVYP